MASSDDMVFARYDETVSSWRARLPRSRIELESRLLDYRIYFAYNSGKIENDSITYHDTREVFENGRAVAFTGDVRTLFEIQNQKECSELLLNAFEEKREIDKVFVLEVHRTLTQGTYDSRRWSLGERPGSYRLHDYVVGLNGVGSPADAVAADIDELLGELDQATSENVLTAAAYFHLAFESVHPFADGNGRVGRALMNHMLVMNEHPPIIIYDEDKLAYYGALQVWDDEGDLAPMLDFLRAEAVKTWPNPGMWLREPEPRP